MAWMRTTMLAALIALVAVVTRAEASPGYGGAGKTKFRVTGKVLCQDCTKNWNAYAYNAKPIAGSAVGVTCRDRETGRTVFYDWDHADGNGVFNVDVPYSVNGRTLEVEPSECLVRLVSSGDSGCAVRTNFNGGKTGQSPSRPSRNYPGDIAYTVGPYYYTVPQCDVDEKSY